MDSQRDLFREEHDLFTQALASNPTRDVVDKAADDETPLYHFDHPYPRFGLAYTLFHHGIHDDLKKVIADDERLAMLAAEVIDDSLNYVRLHTEDRSSEDGETKLNFQFVAGDELKDQTGNKQKAGNLYYPWPHIATGDSGVNGLIRKARKFRDKLKEGEKFYSGDRELKRSFSPFTTKINAGTKSLSNPKATRLGAVFTLIATLARYKPGAYTPYPKPSGETGWCNQVIILDLDLKSLIQFIALFKRLHDSETGDVFTAIVKENSTWYRPPVHNGNYPDAPRTQAFGPVGLMGAMGKWIQRAEHVDWAKNVLEKLTERPLYLVSYQPSLMRQEHVGHHVAELALRYDLPKALQGLYRAQHYNADDNKPDSKQRQLFYMMAGRFLQFYTRPAFRDFLSFRVQYDASFSAILEDYFMNKRSLSKDLVQSARTYGAHLNYVAYLVAEEEVKSRTEGEEEDELDEEEKERMHKQKVYKFKSRTLAQLESTALSAKRPSALFAQLNVQSGRASNRDVPAEAERFMEAATAGEIDLDTAKELILAFMRLRTAKGDTSDSTPSEAEEKMMGVQ